MRTISRLLVLVVAATVLTSSGCAFFSAATEEHTTDRDKMKKGAAIGAASGAVLGAVLGEGELDEILAGAAIGAGVGAGVGTYMDNQEEKLAKIPGTTIERKDKDLLLVRFDSDILFAVDSAELSGSSYSALEQAAAVLVEYKKTAIISQGHTDSTGSDEHNQGLSERRAQSVARYLMENGIDSSRITSLGYGESHPVDDNSTTAGRERNRRVDLLLKAKVR
ncbi:MAG: OmpA family protein [Acidobacteriota bacterium]|nr:OmpA family protein [Acidobacteriota bacterium]MDH3786815.1 OmpA family protein [Acidobacteriota bacterium]